MPACFSCHILVLLSCIDNGFAPSKIYFTTSPSESLYSRASKIVTGKSVFLTETAQFKSLYLAFAAAEKRRTMRTRNWSEIMD
jgi:transposase-like protein